MEPADIIVLPRLQTERFELDVVQVDAAVELVRRGAATRVRLVGLADADELASTALARAQAAGVSFAIDRGSTGLTLTIGPRTDP
jgi:hypothetical protein